MLPRVFVAIVAVVVGGYFVRLFVETIEPIGDFCDPHDWEVSNDD